MVLKSLLAQAAFVKNSIILEGRHLCLLEKGICYIRIPKAASTSILDCILRKKVSRLETKQMSGEQINFLADIHMSRRIEHGEKGCAFFTVVRNPFARIVSVYRAFLDKSGEEYLYDDYLYGIIRKDLSFKEFVRRVWCIPDSLRDQHIKTQTSLLKFYSRRNIPITVFKLEQWENVRDFLLQRDLEFKVIHGANEEYDYRAYYDLETARLVTEIYTEDVTAFGYDEVAASLAAFTVRK